MEQIVYVLKIIFYIIYIWLIYISTKKISDKEVTKKEYSLKQGKIIIQRKKKTINISKISIILFALLFGLYSSIVSVRPYASDRAYYARLYGNSILEYQLPAGYAFLTKILYNISENPDFLFFAISFLMVVIILCVYRNFEDANTDGILLLFTSLYFIYGFHLLKQGIAIVLGTVSILNIFNKKYLKAILWLVIAVLFHEAALILIPIEIALIGSKKKSIRIVEYLSLIIITIGFSAFAEHISSTITSIMPSLENDMGNYFSGLTLNSNNIATAIKGIPVYVITVVSFLKRKELSKDIKNYDKYMVLSIFTSLTYILSAYMYWTYRFGLFCMFFVFMFFGKIIKIIKNRKEKQIYLIVVYGGTGFLTIRYLSQMFFIYGGF